MGELEYVDDVINHLLTAERQLVREPIILRQDRSRLINWLMTLNTPHGNPAVIQTGIWYMDSVLALDDWHVIEMQKLLALACFRIALKIQGDFRVTRIQLSKLSSFPKRSVIAAENVILKKLGFPINPIVAQDFIPYLAWHANQDMPGDIEKAATFLCLSGVMASKKICLMFPSVVACAVIRCAIKTLRGNAAVQKLEECPLYKTVDKTPGEIHEACKLIKRAVRTVIKHSTCKAALEYYEGWPQFINLE